MKRYRENVWIESEGGPLLLGRYRFETAAYDDTGVSLLLHRMVHDVDDPWLIPSPALT